MAQVDSRTRQDVDQLLKVLRATWERLPAVAAEIDTWDLLDQLHFTEEWPLTEDRLARLEQYADQGVLSPPQQTRYQALQRIIARNRPLVQRILEG